MNEEGIKKSWYVFTKNNNFILNPDKNHVDLIIKGVLHNEKNCGLKLCPCRLRDGTFKRDLELICPCNFKSQDTWKEKGQCWCGLFIKRC